MYVVSNTILSDKLFLSLIYTGSASIEKRPLFSNASSTSGYDISIQCVFRRSENAKKIIETKFSRQAK